MDLNHEDGLFMEQLTGGAMREISSEGFDRIIVLPIKDNPSDLLWSQELDRIAMNQFPKSKITLYGSRDSFIPHYHGKLKVERIKPVPAISATELRKLIAENPKWRMGDFRQGVIYAAEKRWPQLYQCVDIAVIDRRDNGVFLLLGRKHKKDGWCFPGGFVDPTDASLEAAAKRELCEETNFNLEADDFNYEGSTLVDDWRYPGPDRLMTSLFSASRVFGSAGFAKAGDDLPEVFWFDVTKERAWKKCRSLIKKPHQPLFDMLEDRLVKARTAYHLDNYRPKESLF